MSCNPDDPAFPISALGTADPGITKREYFAAMAMQGLASIQNPECFVHKAIAKHAVILADAMIAALNQTERK